MSDKVLLIKQEIERRIEICEKYSQLNLTESTSIGNHAQLLELREIKDFINYLPEEPASDDLEEAADKYAENHGFRVPYDGSNKFYDDVDVKASKEGFIAGAEWGRNHFEDKNEMVSEDLEEAANQHSKQVFHGLLVEDNITAFKAGAEWQKQKDQETIELAEDHAMLAGMNKMKEEMMKDALSGQIYRSNDGDVKILAVKGNTDKLYRGTNIKFIILKTE